MKKIQFSLTTQIVIALVLAIIAGVLLNDHADFVNHYIKPFGTIFLKLLKFIVVPLVLLSIIAGILSMNDMKKLGRLGLRAVLYFMFTTVLAVILGLGLSTLVRGWLPTIDMTSAASSASEVEVELPSFMEQIVNMFPDNFLNPLNNMNMTQVIIIAIFFGVAMVHVGRKEHRQGN